jgi:hypothetical protein
MSKWNDSSTIHFNESSKLILQHFCRDIFFYRSKKAIPYRWRLIDHISPLGVRKLALGDGSGVWDSRVTLNLTGDIYHT